jgi:programmed cell death protein 5
MDPNQASEQYEKVKKQEEQKAQMEEMRANILGQILDADAKERLSRIKLVRAEKASQIENYLIKAAQNGTLQGKVTEKYLIDLLEQISEKKSETKITIQRRGYGGLDDDF